MKKANPTLTPLELDIMKVIWDRGEATGRDVHEALSGRRKIAYTTVMTMLKVLETKGHVTKRREEPAHVYRPTRSKRVVVRSMVREFLERVFDGSAQPLLVHLVEDRKISEEQLDDLMRKIRESE
jgi:BlaI family transcriptional regulator, penicillinase repressor